MQLPNELSLSTSISKTGISPELVVKGFPAYAIGMLLDSAYTKQTLDDPGVSKRDELIYRLMVSTWPPNIVFSSVKEMTPEARRAAWESWGLHDYIEAFETALTAIEPLGGGLADFLLITNLNVDRVAHMIAVTQTA